MNLVSIKDYVAAEKQRIKEKLADCDKQYRLDIFQIGDIDASNRYIKWKMNDCEEVGIKAVLHKFEFDESMNALDFTEYFCHELQYVIKSTDGVILQLPAPDFIKNIVNSKIKLSEKPWIDVDGMFNRFRNPCTPRGIIDWLEFNNVKLDGANVTIIGRSDIVGKPLARMMLERNATVTVCHSHTDEMVLLHNCEEADVIVSAVGKPEFLCASDILTYDQIVVDVGINIDEEGKLCGDIYNDFEYGDLNDLNIYITPVPGGVGLLTRLALLKNVIGE